jgi:hypothetical protein
VASFDAARAAAFWSSQVFVKTYVETRSWWAVFRVFWRVWALNLLGLQLMAVLAFFGGNVMVLTSLVPAHALLVALERLATAATCRHPSASAAERQAHLANRAAAQARQRRTMSLNGKQPQPASGAPMDQPLELSLARLLRPRVRLAGSMVWGLGGWLEATLVAVGLCLLYAWRLNQSSSAVPVIYIETHVDLLTGVTLDAWYMVAASYVAVHVLHWLLTSRDG